MNFSKETHTRIFGQHKYTQSDTCDVNLSKNVPRHVTVKCFNRQQPVNKELLRTRENEHALLSRINQKDAEGKMQKTEADRVTQ